MHRFRQAFFLLLGLLLSQIVTVVYGQALQVLNLKVDLLEQPMFGVTNGYPIAGDDSHQDAQSQIISKQPLLGWELSSTDHGVMQSAYRILLSAERDSLEKGVGDVWDSGKIISSESTHIRYEGESLKPGTLYVWKVVVWDQEGKASQVSPISQFMTADTLTVIRLRFIRCRRRMKHHDNCLNLIMKYVLILVKLHLASCALH